MEAIPANGKRFLATFCRDYSREERSRAEPSVTKQSALREDAFNSFKLFKWFKTI